MHAGRECLPESRATNGQRPVIDDVSGARNVAAVGSQGVAYEP